MAIAARRTARMSGLRYAPTQPSCKRIRIRPAGAMPKTFCRATRVGYAFFNFPILSLA